MLPAVTNISFLNFQAVLYVNMVDTEEVMQMINTMIKEKTREYFGFGTKRMMELKVCDKCKTAVSAQKHFCTNCHAWLPHKTLYDIYKSNHRLCKNCQTILPNGAQYCPQCGVSLGKTYKSAVNKIAL